MKVKTDILWRIGLLYFGIVLFALIIIGRIIYLQYFEREKWNKANTLTTNEIIIPPNRGDICAEDGRLLATSIPYYEIRMDMKCDALSNDIFNKHIDSLAYHLSNLFRDKSKQKYKQELVNARYRGSRYHLIRRKVNYLELKELKTFPIFRLGQYRGGFIYIEEYKRIHPFGDLAFRTIGSLNKSGNIVGIEGAYDEELHGKQGVRRVQKLSGNVWIPISDGNEVDPQHGKEIITTIDINIQDVAQNALETQLRKHNASHGTVVLMEVETGDIKAIANLTLNSKGNYIEAYNYAIGESTEPGSTFKLATLLVALEDKFVDLNDSIDTGNGVVKFHGHKIKDSNYKNGGHGKITVREAFELSSNVAMAKIITQYYYDNERKFVDRLYRMGLNERLGIEIRGEGKPYIKYPGDTLWSGITLPQMAYGYEVQLTPLQLLAFYNAVANDGKMVKPKFVKAIRYHGEIIKEFKTEVINPSICSKSSIKKVQSLLEGVVENGTAKNLKNSYYKIAGKTGTAQIANKNYGYRFKNKINYTASFVGYFPAKNPRYSCIVVINSPSNQEYYGNRVAGPVFKEISDKVYATSLDMLTPINQDDEKIKHEAPYSKNGSLVDLKKVLDDLNIELIANDIKSDWVVTTAKDSVIELSNRYIKTGLVPNVKGMGVKDAVPILEMSGLYVTIKGRGSVVSQSISPGSRIHKGEEIVLTLI